MLLLAQSRSILSLSHGKMAWSCHAQQQDPPAAPISGSYAIRCQGLSFSASLHQLLWSLTGHFNALQQAGLQLSLRSLGVLTC